MTQLTEPDFGYLYINSNRRASQLPGLAQKHLPNNHGMTTPYEHDKTRNGGKMKLKKLKGTHAIARLEPGSPIPDWADGDGFVSISRTDDELSIVCHQDRIPASEKQDRDWTCFKFQGPFAFGETGVVLSVVEPLSENGIGIFVVSTFDGDHLLVKTSDAEASEQFLAAAGHSII
jgi:uncharacterized protein